MELSNSAPALIDAPPKAVTAAVAAAIPAAPTFAAFDNPLFNLSANAFVSEPDFFKAFSYSSVLRTMEATNVKTSILDHLPNKIDQH